MLDKRILQDVCSFQSRILEFGKWYSLNDSRYIETKKEGKQFFSFFLYNGSIVSDNRICFSGCFNHAKAFDSKNFKIFVPLQDALNLLEISEFDFNCFSKFYLILSDFVFKNAIFYSSGRKCRRDLHICDNVIKTSVDNKSVIVPYGFIVKNLEKTGTRIITGNKSFYDLSLSLEIFNEIRECPFTLQGIDSDSALFGNFSFEIADKLVIGGSGPYLSVGLCQFLQKGFLENMPDEFSFTTDHILSEELLNKSLCIYKNGNIGELA